MNLLMYVFSSGNTQGLPTWHPGYVTHSALSASYGPSSCREEGGIGGQKT